MLAPIAFALRTSATEVPELMVKQGMKVETYFTADGDDLRGINTPEDLEICEKILLQRSTNI